MKFGTLFQFIRNGMNVQQNKSRDGLPISRIETIAEAVVDGARVGYAGLAESQCADWLLRPGDILFSHINSPEHVGKCAVYRGTPAKLVHGMNLLCLRSDPAKLSPEFGKYLIRSDRFRARLSNFVNRAVNQASVSIANLRSISVEVPPLAEQERIADVLDRADALRAKRRAALAKLDELTQSIFVDLFGQAGPPVTIGNAERHPQGWRWELLTEVARLATGHTPDRKRPDYWNGDIPWLTLSEIRRFDGRVAGMTSECITQAGVDNSAAVRLPARTVCFSRTASLGFVTVMPREMATSQDFVNWVCGPALDPTYLMYALMLARERLRSLSTGSTHRTIYFSTVEQFRVLLPPVDLQRRFAATVAVLDGLKTSHDASLAEMDALFASLQHRAFRGEL